MDPRVYGAYFAELEKLAFFGPRTWALAQKFPNLAAGLARGSHGAAQAAHGGAGAAGAVAAGATHAAAPAIRAADKVVAPAVNRVAQKARYRATGTVNLKRPGGWKNPEQRPLARATNFANTVAQVAT